MIWEAFQNQRIAEAKTKAESASKTSFETKTSVDDLARKVDYLALICRAMWGLIQEHTELTDKDLLARVKEMDMRDGVPDGRFRETKHCIECGRVTAAKQSACIYCGAENPITNAFSKL